ncbi:MAG: type II toxin-antitoxin system HicA family toxin [Chloroflexi bacterium]|nr:type II toxin-antitoxin system HicA family toxin [Chloroflexota bacterium]
MSYCAPSGERGGEPVRQVGSHVHLRHPERSGRVTVPVHAGETLHPKTLASILAQAGMAETDLLKFL